jgi:hypothetical protein
MVTFFLLDPVAAVALDGLAFMTAFCFDGATALHLTASAVFCDVVFLLWHQMMCAGFDLFINQRKSQQRLCSTIDLSHRYTVAWRVPGQA